MNGFLQKEKLYEKLLEIKIDFDSLNDFSDDLLSYLEDILVVDNNIVGKDKLDDSLLYQNKILDELNNYIIPEIENKIN